MEQLTCTRPAELASCFRLPISPPIPILEAQSYGPHDYSAWNIIPTLNRLIDDTLNWHADISGHLYPRPRREHILDLPIHLPTFFPFSTLAEHKRPWPLLLP